MGVASKSCPWNTCEIRKNENNLDIDKKDVDKLREIDKFPLSQANSDDKTDRK